MSAPRSARRVVAAALRAPSERDSVDDVVLVVSELVTNALQHGIAPIELAMTTDGFVYVHVADGSPAMPHLVAEPSDGGRGLRLVAAVASEWGARRSGAGKVVWASFDGGSTS